VSQLEYQRHFREVSGIVFCYVCGKMFQNGETRNYDHIPAKACFAARDRNFPLQLPTHIDCNSGHKLLDEKIGQVLKLKYAKGTRSSNNRLRFKFFPPSAGRGTIGAVTNVDIRGAVSQWIRGFHAALYKEPLEDGSRFAFETPFPEARMTATGGELIGMRLAQHRVFVETVKVNRAARNVDFIECNNRKLRYECVWAQSDNGPWICVFALDLYEWSDLGDINHFPKRGCAGMYAMPRGTAPRGASIATKLRIAIPNYQPLDPFAR
jgi:hypothetical protein